VAINSHTISRHISTKKSGKVPGTDRTYTKAAHTTPKFKMGKTLKDAVAGN